IPELSAGQDRPPPPKCRQFRPLYHVADWELSSGFPAVLVEHNPTAIGPPGEIGALWIENGSVAITTVVAYDCPNDTAPLVDFGMRPDGARDHWHVFGFLRRNGANGRTAAVVSSDIECCSRRFCSWRFCQRISPATLLAGFTP